MAKYRVSALQLLCVKSGVFLFFCFFFNRTLSVFEHLLKPDPHLKTFCLVSNNVAPEILTRLICNKCFIFANGRFSRRLLGRNTGGLQIILKSFTVKCIHAREYSRLKKSNSAVRYLKKVHQCLLF